MQLRTHLTFSLTWIVYKITPSSLLNQNNMLVNAMTSILTIIFHSNYVVNNIQSSESAGRVCNQSHQSNVSSSLQNNQVHEDCREIEEPACMKFKT